MVNIQPRQEILLNAISATATSRGVGVDSAGRLSIMFIAGGVASGSATYYVQVSNKQDSGYVPYNRLVSNVTNTNAQNDTRVGLINQTANGTAIVFFPQGDTFNYIRVQGDVWATGNFSAVLYVN